MKYKKADGEFWKIVAAIIALVVLVVMIVIFTKFIGKEKGTVGTQIDETSNDYDCDGVKNIIDRCCDTSTGAREEVDVMGCAPDQKEPKSCKGLTQQTC